MPKAIQVSAVISKDTRDLLEELVRTTGLKKAYVLDMALRHHLQALQEVPADLIIPPRMVISRHSGQEVLDRIRSPRRPTPALRRLMRDHGD